MAVVSPPVVFEYEPQSPICIGQNCCSKMDWIIAEVKSLILDRCQISILNLDNPTTMWSYAKWSTCACISMSQGCTGPGSATVGPEESAGRILIQAEGLCNSLDHMTITSRPAQLLSAPTNSLASRSFKHKWVTLMEEKRGGRTHTLLTSRHSCLLSPPFRAAATTTASSVLQPGSRSAL